MHIEIKFNLVILKKLLIFIVNFKVLMMVSLLIKILMTFLNLSPLLSLLIKSLMILLKLDFIQIHLPNQIHLINHHEGNSNQKNNKVLSLEIGQTKPPNPTSEKTSNNSNNSKKSNNNTAHQISLPNNNPIKNHKYHKIQNVHKTVVQNQIRYRFLR